MRKLMIKNTIKWNKQIYYAAIDMLPNSSDNNKWLVLRASLKTHSSSAMSFFCTLYVKIQGEYPYLS